MKANSLKIDKKEKEYIIFKMVMYMPENSKIVNSTVVEDYK